MKLGLCIEASSRQKVAAVEDALRENGHSFLNFGMFDSDDIPQLTYMHTGFLTALFLNLEIVSFVVGGCGTGQGYMNAVLQYPIISCGLIVDTTDAWLFSQINAGNVVSLSLNKGFGTLGGDKMISHIVEKLFTDPIGMGFPPHRAEIQKAAKIKLDQLSICNHLPMDVIVERMDREIVQTSLKFPGIVETIRDKGVPGSLKDVVLAICGA